MLLERLKEMERVNVEELRLAVLNDILENYNLKCDTWKFDNLCQLVKEYLQYENDNLIYDIVSRQGELFY